MQESNLEPRDGKCVCGRKLKDAAVYVFRSHTDRCLYHRCACGAEWTEHQIDVDPADPVSSEEVIEVHVRLAKFEGSLSDLLEQRSA